MLEVKDGFVLRDIREPTKIISWKKLRYLVRKRPYVLKDLEKEDLNKEALNMFLKMIKKEEMNGPVAIYDIEEKTLNELRKVFKHLAHLLNK